jgi:SAM-dependent methyltransferase
MRLAVFCFALLLAVPAQADVVAVDSTVDAVDVVSNDGVWELRDVATRIQQECLAAYAPDLIARMAPERSSVPRIVSRYPVLQYWLFRRAVALEKGLFFPSGLDEMLPSLKAHVSTGVRFLDLGSGDGRVVFLANVLGAHATGIEYDATLVATSLRAQKALAELLDPVRLRILEGDFFDHAWSGYDVIFYYDLGSSEPARLREKLRSEMKPDAHLIVYREQIPFEGFEPVGVLGNLKVLRRPRLDAAGG